MRKSVRILAIAVALYMPGAFNARAISSEEATRVVTAAYEDILGRKPDAEGLRVWRSKMVDEGWKEKDIRNALKKSTEHKQDEVNGIITRAYEDILGRKPDQAEVKLYRDKMTKEGLSEKKLREALRNSPEAKRRK
jgi:hypothetical protein